MSATLSSAMGNGNGNGMNALIRGVALGAAAGIILSATFAFGIVMKSEDHFVTRREYEATLSSINSQLSEIKGQLHQIQNERQGRRDSTGGS